MATYKINADIDGATFHKTVEAVKYRHEGDYFNFYSGGDGQTYSVAARHVHTIEKVKDSE